MARVSAAINRERIELAPEPVHGERHLGLRLRDRPVRRRPAEKVALLADWSGRLLARDGVDHVDASLLQVKENKFYADGATTTTQQRVRVHPALTAVAIEQDGRFETMRTLAPPAGRGWEYLTGTGWDWEAELRSCRSSWPRSWPRRRSRPAPYDLVIDPSNLWLTIHESIGHATELDRALGYEAAYAGTSFATLDKLGTLQYGSDLMHVTGDRTAQHGLSTIGYDDEGVAGAVLGPDPRRRPVGYQLDRRMAQRCAARSAPTAAPSPTRPATCRCSGWRTCRCSRPRAARPPRS